MTFRRWRCWLVAPALAVFFAWRVVASAHDQWTWLGSIGMPDLRQALSTDVEATLRWTVPDDYDLLVALRDAVADGGAIVLFAPPAGSISPAKLEHLTTNLRVLLFPIEVRPSANGQELETLVRRLATRPLVIANLAPSRPLPPAIRVDSIVRRPDFELSAVAR